MSQPFKEDCVDILRQQYKEGVVSRRTVLAAITTLGITATVGPVFGANAKELVVVNWGGDAIPAYDKAFGASFSTKVKIDGSGPLEGSMKTQVESGSVRWDVCDAEPYSALRLGRNGMIEPIDYSVVDKNKIEPGFDYKYCAPSYFFSHVIAYDAARFGSNAPNTWADFWDVKKFPGKRTLYKWMTGVLEAALLADGVKADKLYPLDVDRALEKINELKPHIVAFWGSGAESQQLLRDGEASLGFLWHTRANLTQQDTDGAVKWTFNEGLVTPSGWTVLKGNPAGAKTAMAFIAHCQDPKNQLVLLEAMGNGPANPATHALVPEHLKAVDASSKQNLAKQVAIQADWYAEHYGAALDKYLALVGS